MTGPFDDVRRAIGVLSGDKLTVRVPEDVVDDDVDHSFRSVAFGGNTPEGIVTVTLEAGHTRLRIGGVDVTFAGYRYFPRVPDDYDTVDYRGDVGDASIDFDGVPDHVGDLAAVRNTTVDDLITGLSKGLIEPLPADD